MDPDTALEFVKQGTTLLLLDVPQYTLIGIDTQMFSSGHNFKGIKMIPPGIHFISYSSSNREGREFSPIVGFFIKAYPSQIIVRKWDQKEERLVRLSEEHEERYSNAVKRFEFDTQLGPYTLSQYGEWKNLSNYITKDTIEKLDFETSGLVNSVNEFRFQTVEVDTSTESIPCGANEPIGGEISVACESIMVGKFSKTSMDRALAEQLKNSKFSIPEDTSQKRGCYYTTIPRVVKQKGLCGKDLSSLNLDKTKLLESILMKEYGGNEDALLAELQFAFIAFLMGQSLEAFLQWKLLLNLLFGCTESPLYSRSRLFTKFIKVVYYQLKFGFQRDQKDAAAMTEGLSLLDESWLSSDSFLHHLCKDFFSVVLEAPVVDGDLLSWVRSLKTLLDESLGWKFQQNIEGDVINFEDGDEYAPVVEILDNDVYRE